MPGRRRLQGLVTATIVLGVTLMLFGCSPVDVLNGLASFSDYEVWHASYGPGNRHSMDIYSPPLHDAPAPVVVFFYGGGWEDGDKAMYRFVGAALAARGILTVIPDYRVYPEVRFPGFIEDGADATRWTRDHIAKYGGDPNRMVLMGHSAGAHIAAMLTFDAQWLHAVGMDPARDIRGMVGLAGPYDFLPLQSETLKIIFGPESGRGASQPINFVDGTAPPAFLATDRDDDTVDPRNTARLAERIRQRGGSVAVRVYDHVSHRTLIGAFSPPLRVLAPVLSDVTTFVDTVTARPTTADGLSSVAGKPVW